MQPAWHPATGALYYISDSSGYYNLRRIAPPTGGDGDGGGGGALAGPGAAILPRDADFGGSSPGWSLGQQGYAFLSDGRVAATMPRDGKTRLLVFDEDTAGVADVAAAAAASLATFGDADGLPPSFGSLTPSPDGTLYVLGGAPDVPSGVYAWKGLVAGAGGGTPPPAGAEIPAIPGRSDTAGAEIPDRRIRPICCCQLTRVSRPDLRLTRPRPVRSGQRVVRRRCWRARRRRASPTATRPSRAPSTSRASAWSKRRSALPWWLVAPEARPDSSRRHHHFTASGHDHAGARSESRTATITRPPTPRTRAQARRRRRCWSRRTAVRQPRSGPALHRSHLLHSHATEPWTCSAQSNLRSTPHVSAPFAIYSSRVCTSDRAHRRHLDRLQPGHPGAYTPPLQLPAPSRCLSPLLPPPGRPVLHVARLRGPRRRLRRLNRLRPYAAMHAQT